MSTNKQCHRDYAHVAHLWVSARNEMQCSGSNEPTKVLTREAVDKWLIDQHTTLWMDWDISRQARRELAIDWIMKVYYQLKELEA